MLKIREKIVQFRRTITQDIQKNGFIEKKDIDGDIKKLNSLFNMPETYSFDFMLYLINESIKSENKNQFFRYVRLCGEKNFDEKRYLEYCEYKKNNPSDSGSDKFLQLVYGVDWKKEKEERRKNKKSMYDPKYIADRDGISLNEAIKKVNHFKRNKATSLKGFIKRHGKKEGKKLFNNFQKTSKHTQEKYIKKYGEIDGIKKWNAYVETKKQTSVWTINHWLNKGYSFEEAEKLRKEFHKKNLNTSSVDYWVGKGLPELKAKEKVAEIFKKKKIFFGHASKQSLKTFIPIIEFLIQNNMDGYYIGYGDRQEFSIYDYKNKKIKFYDLTIPELNLIIEFHGYRYHPNKEKLTKEEWKNWKCFGFAGRNQEFTADEKYKLDKEKEQLAKDNGFYYLVIWSDDNKKKNIDKCINFIKEAMNEN